MDGLYLKPTFCSLPSSHVPYVRGQTTGPSFQVCAKYRNLNSPLPPNSVILDKRQSLQSSSFFSSPFKSVLSTVKKQDTSPATAEEERAAQFLEYAMAEQEERSLKGLLGSTNRNKTEENWVLKILQLRSLWRDGKDERLGSALTQEDDSHSGSHELDECCVVEEGDFCSPEAGFRDSFDQDSFSRLLRPVSYKEAKFYGRMSYLVNLSYAIQNIKRDDLLKYLGLRFITSSLEKKVQFPVLKELAAASNFDSLKTDRPIERKLKTDTSPDVAYQIAASAALYLRTQSQNILPSTSSRMGRQKNSDASNGAEEFLGAALDLAKMESCETDISNSGVASLLATTESVTAVVAAKEERRQAVAKDLNSIHFSPCEWFLVDDEKNKIRHFVVQGSESLASWQANLLFEPIQFEGDL